MAVMVTPSNATLSPSPIGVFGRTRLDGVLIASSSRPGRRRPPFGSSLTRRLALHTPDARLARRPGEVDDQRSGLRIPLVAA
jgi:hypothetical protein